MSEQDAHDDNVVDNETEIESGDAGNEMDELQKQLEKQIGTFGRLFARMDADGTEGETALRMLKASMKKINDLQEQLTGSRGDLNFVTLLQKIENGSGGADVSEYEALIAEYQAANEQLKEAETMLRGELERFKLIHKYSDERQPEKVDLRRLAEKSLKEIRTAVEKLQKMTNPDETTVEDLYEGLLDEMLTKDIGDKDASKPGMAHRMVGGIMRAMDYPIDADDAVKMQALAQAQALALKQTNELQAKLDVLHETLPAMADALDLVIYRSGEHPDIARAIDEMKSAMRQADRMQARNDELQKQMSDMAQSHAVDRATWERKNRELTQAVERMDTRMLELCNYILDGGKNPIGRKDDQTGSKKSMTAEERM